MTPQEAARHLRERSLENRAHDARVRRRWTVKDCEAVDTLVGAIVQSASDKRRQDRMGGHSNEEHVEVFQTDDRQWRSRRIYANGEHGERSEEAVEHKTYLIERVQKEHPGTPIKVTPLDEGPYWIDGTPE